MSTSLYNAWKALFLLWMIVHAEGIRVAEKITVSRQDQHRTFQEHVRSYRRQGKHTVAHVLEQERHHQTQDKHELPGWEAGQRIHPGARSFAHLSTSRHAAMLTSLLEVNETEVGHDSRMMKAPVVEVAGTADGNSYAADGLFDTAAVFKTSDKTGYLTVDLGVRYDKIEFVRLWSEDLCLFGMTNTGYYLVVVHDEPLQAELSQPWSRLKDSDGWTRRVTEGKVWHTAEDAKYNYIKTDVTVEDKAEFVDIQVGKPGRYVSFKRIDTFGSIEASITEIEAFYYDPFVTWPEGLHAGSSYINVAANTKVTALVDDRPIKRTEGFEPEKLVDGNKIGRPTSNGVYISPVGSTSASVLVDLGFPQPIHAVRLWSRTKQMRRYMPMRSEAKQFDQFEKLAEKALLWTVKAWRSETADIPFEVSFSANGFFGSKIINVTASDIRVDVQFVQVSISLPSPHARPELTRRTSLATVEEERPAPQIQLSLAEIEAIAAPAPFPDMATMSECTDECRAEIGYYLAHPSLSVDWWNRVKLAVHKQFNAAMEGHESDAVKGAYLAEIFANWNTALNPGNFYGFPHRNWVDERKLTVTLAEAKLGATKKKIMEQIKASVFSDEALVSTCVVKGCERSPAFFADCLEQFVFDYVGMGGADGIAHIQAVQGRAMAQLQYIDPGRAYHRMDEYLGNAISNINVKKYLTDHPDAISRQFDRVCTHCGNDSSIPDEGRDQIASLCLSAQATDPQRTALMAAMHTLLDGLQDEYHEEASASTAAPRPRSSADTDTTEKVMPLVKKHFKKMIPDPTVKHTLGLGTWLYSLSSDIINRKMSNPKFFVKHLREGSGSVSGFLQQLTHLFKKLPADAMDGIRVSVAVLSAIALACAVYDFIEIMRTNGKVLDKLKSTVNLVVTSIGFTAGLLQTLVALDVITNTATVHAIASAASYVGGISAVLTAGVNLYQAVVSFKQGKHLSGTLFLSSFALSLTGGILLILIAAGVFASTVVLLPVAVAMVIVASVLTFLAIWIGRNPVAEVPFEGDTLVKAIEAAISGGLLYQKVRFALPHKLQCYEPAKPAPSLSDLLSPDTGLELSQLCMKSLISKPVLPTRRIEPKLLAVRRELDNSTNEVVYPWVVEGATICLGHQNLENLLERLFSKWCVYSEWDTSRTASHHVTRYWVMKGDVDYQVGTDERLWPKNWKPTMMDWYERGANFGCASEYCWSYCAVNWFSSWTCYTGTGGTKRKCTKASDCEYYLPCAGGCTVFSP